MFYLIEKKKKNTCGFSLLTIITLAPARQPAPFCWKVKVKVTRDGVLKRGNTLHQFMTLHQTTNQHASAELIYMRVTIKYKQNIISTVLEESRTFQAPGQLSGEDVSTAAVQRSLTCSEGVPYRSLFPQEQIEHGQSSLL